MTTVYVNKRLGIALTDSRATSEIPRSFYGIMKLTPRTEYSVVTQKALYIHDSLFLATGNVDSIGRILNYLTVQTVPKVDKKTPECECLLLRNDYAVYMNIYKGKFNKRLIYLYENFEFTMGSGYHALWRSLHRQQPNQYLMTHEDVLTAFKEVYKYDTFSDDNINLYRI